MKCVATRFAQREVLTTAIGHELRRFAPNMFSRSVVSPKEYSSLLKGALFSDPSVQ